MRPLPFVAQISRPDFPVYPVPLQVVRVSSATITGPAGQLLYLSSVQQLRTDNLLPRDREPCLVTNVNGIPLQPGYYLGRLASSYNGFPVYEVADYGTLLGLDQGQVDTLRESLTSEQLAVLDNLTPCQLRVLLTTLSIPQLQLVTASSTPTQLTNLTITTPIGRSSTLELVTALTIDQLLEVTTALTNEQLANLVTTVPTSQIQKLIEGLTTTQITSVVCSIPQQQLLSLLTETTSEQLSELVVTLTAQQLHNLSQLPANRIGDMVNNLTVNQVRTLTSLLTGSQLRIMLDSLTISQVSDLFAVLTTQQLTDLITTVTNPNQIARLLQAITVAQLEVLLANLTPTQLRTLVNYPPSTINVLVNNLQVNNLELVLDNNPPAPVIGNQQQLPGLPLIIGQPSSTPTALDGYATTVADNSGNLYTYAGGQWNQVGSGGSGPTGTNGSSTLGSTYSVTGSYGNTGISVTLPSAGVYLILGGIVSAIDGSQHEYSEFRLYDSTNATAVGPLGRHELAATTSAQPHTAVVPLHHIMTVTGSTTVRLEAMTVTGGTAEVLSTSTVMHYVKLA